MQRLNRRTKDEDQIIFGEKLSLQQGDVNNLYRDICDLYSYWVDCNNSKNAKVKLSPTFPSIIRMSLRLLVETAAKDINASWEIKDYIKEHFDLAKKSMTQEQKTTLSSICGGGKTATGDNIVSLLNIGAHQYTASKDIGQIIVLSALVGKMLLVSHGL